MLARLRNRYNLRSRYNYHRPLRQILSDARATVDETRLSSRPPNLINFMPIMQALFFT